MPNNTVLNPGSGGDLIATEDVAGVKYPVSKIVIGGTGLVEGDVASTRPLPAVIRNSTGTELATDASPLRVDPTGTTAQPVSGSVGVTERTAYILRIRQLALRIAKAQVEATTPPADAAASEAL